MIAVARRFVPVVIAAALAAGGCDCGSDGGGASCETATDCAAGETCLDHVCRPARDGGGTDGGTVTGDATRPDGGPPVGLGCSADLRQVLGVDGVSLRTCPADQGCHEGLCIPACEAATSSRGTVACDFWVGSPGSYPSALPPCFAMFVANAWPAPAHLVVSRGATTFDVTTFGRIARNDRPPEMWDPVPATGLPEGEVAVLFLSSDPAAILPETGSELHCPVTPAIDASTFVPGSIVADAWHVTADVPVRAYDMLPYGGAHSHFPSAELLLPSSAWGTDYVVIDAPPGTHDVPGPLWIHVLASEDGTTVRIQPTTDLPAGAELPAIAAGGSGTVVLGAGRYAQWELGPNDPSGTLISADRPVAVFAGNRFLRLQPIPNPGGDSTHQQLLPVNALASEYVAAPYETRRADLLPEVIPYRFVGAFDGTTLAYDPPIPGAPTSLDRGAIAEVRTELAFVVRSQDAMHPFAFAQMMTTANLSGDPMVMDPASRPGATATSAFGPWLGDEEFVLTFPPGQWLETYVFFTDPSYPTTNLVFVRRRIADELATPVTVACLGEIGGWRPIGDGTYEHTTADLIRAGIPVGACNNGRHLAQSPRPFGLIVWGEDAYSSYAYPAGGNARRLAELPPLL
jgi:hypothetical protein